jgi:hypothetical protein
LRHPDASAFEHSFDLGDTQFVDAAEKVAEAGFRSEILERVEGLHISASAMIAQADNYQRTRFKGVFGTAT